MPVSNIICRGRRGVALIVKIIIILRAGSARNETNERRARKRVHASHTHLAPLSRAAREAICRMTNERRATWVASAAAGNGEQRAVSPRALLSQRCVLSRSSRAREGGTS